MCNALRIRGGVGNDLDFPSSSKNQYDIEILTQSRFMLPGHPVIDFRIDFQIPLDAGLASISINGIPVLIIAQGNDSAGRGPLANPTRALATPQQVADCDARGVRLFGILLNYLIRGSPQYRYLSTFFRGDGYFAYQFIITNSNLPRTEEQARALRKEWDDVTIEKAIPRPKLESYYAQFHWAEFLRYKGAQLQFNGTQIVNKFMKSNVRSFYEQHLTLYENNRALIPLYPANYPAATHPPYMTAAPWVNPNANQEDVAAFARLINNVWVGYFIFVGVKGDPFGMRAVECEPEDDADHVNILVSNLTEKHECRYCKQKGHWEQQIDADGRTIYCTKFLIDKGFPTTKDGRWSSLKKPMRSFAKSSKRFTTSMNKGAKALLLTAAHMSKSSTSGSTSVPPEITRSLEELSVDNDDSDSDDSGSANEEVAEKVSDQQQRRNFRRSKSPHPVRSKRS